MKNEPEHNPDIGQLETAKCTLCCKVPSSGFFTGCMIRDIPAKGGINFGGWSCDGAGNLTRRRVAPEQALPATGDAARIAELEQENEALHGKLTAAILGNEDELAQLRAQLAASEKDKARIDWLAEELKKWRTGMLKAEAPSHQPDWLYYVEIDGGFRRDKSLRAAIDAAMKEAR